MKRSNMKLPKDFWEQLPLKTETELYDMLAHQTASTIYRVSP
jgi:hypothetical protein